MLNPVFPGVALDYLQNINLENTVFQVLTNYIYYTIWYFFCKAFLVFSSFTQIIYHVFVYNV